MSIPDLFPPQQMPTVTRIDSLCAMARAEGLWRALDRATTARLVWFQGFDWCYRWMQHHGSDRCQPLVFLVQDAEGASAILPLMRVKSRLGLTRLHVLGTPHTQYANILTRNGTLDAASLSALRRALAAEPGIDQTLFDLVPEGSALAQLVQGHVAMASLANVSSQLDLSAFATAADYEATVGKKTSRNLRRAMKQLEQAGPVRLAVVRPDAADYASLVQQCLKMKTDWLNYTGRVSDAVVQDGHAAFLAAMEGDGSNGPLAFALMVGDKPVAIELGYLQHGHYYAYMGAFAWALRNLSPGKLQMHLSIQWLVEHGAKTLDLLGNPSDYKQHYATGQVRLASYAIAPTLRGQVYTRLWTALARPRAKQLYQQLPATWRTSLQVMRKLEYNFGA